MKPAQEPDQFAEFWAIWRHYQRATDGRGKARQPFAAKLASGANPADMIDGARWYLRNLKERDREFIPLAATWINSERWADDCELERQFQARVKAQEERRHESPPLDMSTLAKPKFLQAWEQSQETSH